MSPIRIFLCGDVMTGRGIDQILRHPSNPILYESYVTSAHDYVRLAEFKNGPIGRPVDYAYIWGIALEEWSRARPDVRIVNLETSITRSENVVRKGINYRMSPENVGCLLAAGIDCCVLGNNHVLDWEAEGLIETLQVLERHRLKTSGAGRNLAQASAPAVHIVPDRGRVLVYSYAAADSGTPMSWAAAPDKAGVNFLSALSELAAERIGGEIARTREPGDVVIVSIHWGPNWGYEIPEAQRRFSRALIDSGQISAVHGHSSHHPKGFEIYRNRLVLYGCGDLMNDYEGIGGYEEFRGDLAVMYFTTFDSDDGHFIDLEMVVCQIKRFQLNTASDEDVDWLRTTIERESAQFGIKLQQLSGNLIKLRTAA